MDLILLIGVAVIIIAIVKFLLSDADPVLLLYEKFGKSPASLKGKVVWITGASSGIGEHIAYELAKNGCKLILSARRVGELDRVKKECVARFNRNESDIMVHPFDVLDMDEHQKLTEEAWKYFDRIDILMNNAGRSQRGAFFDTPFSVHRSMFELNVLSVISLTKAVLPHMIEQKRGQVAVISSLAGRLGVPFSATYSATKHALQGLFMSLQTELSGTTIDITTICPGSVKSDVMKNAFSTKDGEAYGVDVGDSGRMSTDRCAYLSTVAVANRLLEVWMARQPQLLFCFFAAHFPVFTSRIIRSFGMKLFTKIRK